MTGEKLNFEVLLDRYRHKIITPREVTEKIGSFPRSKKLIMCHGVFDVVHPGHLRHFVYAKSKADYLLVTITCDEHIDKGIYRPHIPQGLRALNVAAYELIDFVCIDYNKTPIQNLFEIKPDLFAKGYEYGTNDENPKTDEEIETVSSYGGNMLFTPGDIVFSSSKIIDTKTPDLRHEKLAALMEQHSITFDSLRKILSSLQRTKVHIIGDTIVDSFTTTTMIGGQTKTPTISVKFEEIKHFIGGAAVVARHLAAAGASVNFSTILGDDSLGNFVRQGIKEKGLTIDAVSEISRPTTEKNAIIANGYRLLKIDTLENNSINPETLSHFVDKLKDSDADIVIFSDFRHGIFNGKTIPELIEAIPPNAQKVGDSQVASRWGNICDFYGFDLITPNEREARFSSGDQDSGIRPLASKLYLQSGCKTLFLKLGERGMAVCSAGEDPSAPTFSTIEPFVDNVIDPVGAGDALLAYASLAKFVSGCDISAAIIGIMAASAECERDGNIPIEPAAVLKKLTNIEMSMRR